MAKSVRSISVVALVSAGVLLASHFVKALRSRVARHVWDRRSRAIRWVAVSTGVLSICAFGGAPAQGSVSVRDGRLFVVSQAPACCDIFSVDPNGAHPRRLTHVAPRAVALDASPSRDGRHIVYRVFHPQAMLSPSELRVMNADGSGQRPLFSDPFFFDVAPHYSPTGARVVFSRCRPDGSACALYRVNADGTHLRALTPFRPDIYDTSPQYSPDGRHIAFGGYGRGGVQGAVYVMRADGTHRHRLTPARLGSFGPAWSPNGKQLLVQSNCCNASPKATWLVSADGSGLRQLTHPTGGRNDYGAVWAPAGDRIAFGRSSPDGSRTDLWQMRPDGSGAHLVRANAAPTGWSTAP